ncbi:MAG: cytochrome c [Saprospiraceae bacterium]|nr:cytochrome c [Saprospiraceae bacterium]
MKWSSLLLVFSLLAFGTSCSQREESCAAPAKKKIYNPNGDSELALLMRDMFDEGMRVKEEVAVGKRPMPKWDADAIFTAHATQPDKVATPEFKAYAQAFLEAAKAMEDASPEAYRQSYQGMVKTCVACHQEVCPGPIVKINKMLLDESQGL